VILKYRSSSWEELLLTLIHYALWSPMQSFTDAWAYAKVHLYEMYPSSLTNGSDKDHTIL
jgi:hypothetical protein